MEPPKDNQFVAFEGVFDEELMQLQLEYDNISTENAIKHLYIEAFKKQLAEPVPPPVKSSNSQSLQNAESAQAMLDKMTDLRLDLLCSTTSNKSKKDLERNLLLSFQDRKNNFVKLHKMVRESVKKQKDSELEAECRKVAAQLDIALENLAQNQKKCEELTLEVESKEKDAHENIEHERENLAAVEKELAAFQAELNTQDEEVLCAEVASMTEQFKSNRLLLKEWDNDDDSSIYSDALGSEQGALTPTKIQELDFNSFFKNPNDFPELKLPTIKQTPPDASSTLNIGSTSKSLAVLEKSTVLKSAPKPLKAKDKLKERKKRSSMIPVSVAKVSPLVAAEPPKKTTRRSAPVQPVSKPTESAVQTTESAIAQTKPPEVTLKRQTLTFNHETDENLQSNGPNEETRGEDAEMPDAKMQSTVGAVEDNAGEKDKIPEAAATVSTTGSESSLFGGSVDGNPQPEGEHGDVPGEDAEMLDDSMQSMVDAVENNTGKKLPKAAVVISPTGSVSSLFGGGSEMNFSRVSGEPGENVFDSSFSGDENNSKAGEKDGKDLSFGNSSDGGGFNFFGEEESNKSGSGGFFGF